MIRVILVEPEGDENVGAVTRAMKNFDVTSLMLINPKCNHLSDKARNYSVHAENLLESAQVQSDLDSALRGSDVSVAMSRRIGQWRKRDLILKELPDFLGPYNEKVISIVFGREQTGLTNDEILACDLICSIPTSDEFPSMNLAQAATVTLYEVTAYRFDHQREIADREIYDQMFEQMFATFSELGFFKNVPEWRLRNYLNKLMLRAQPDNRDVKAIKNIFRRIEGIVIRLKTEAEK